MTETWTPPPAPPTPPPPRRRWLPIAALGTVGALGLGAAVVVGVETAGSPRAVVGTASPAGLQSPAADVAPWGRFGHHFGQGLGGFGSGSLGSGGAGSGGSTSGNSTGSATAAQEAGVVDVDTILGYQQSAAAGTGMVLTSNGEVLTNNHVIDGATSISVTVVSSGRTYAATVVGTDPTDDVAVLQLDGASGLATITASTVAATVGEAVTAVGNAGGNGGTPSAASGQVTALDQTITATDENGGNAERLTGLIQTDADIQPGDSGGPLYGTTGAVIGMDTAASSGGAVQGYAIPIGAAETIARQIENGGGTQSTTPPSGSRAFLGVEVQPGADGGAAVAGVLPGSAADQAGLLPGDVITGVGRQQIGSADDLSAALAQYSPGQRARITWTTPGGSTRSATVALGTAPTS